MPRSLRQEYHVGEKVEVRLGTSLSTTWTPAVVTMVSSDYLEIECDSVKYGVRSHQLEYIRKVKVRRHSFVNWINKLEGKGNDHAFT